MEGLTPSKTGKECYEREKESLGLEVQRDGFRLLTSWEQNEETKTDVCCCWITSRRRPGSGINSYR